LNPQEIAAGYLSGIVGKSYAWLCGINVTETQPPNTLCIFEYLHIAQRRCHAWAGRALDFERSRYRLFAIRCAGNSLGSERCPVERDRIRRQISGDNLALGSVDVAADGLASHTPGYCWPRAFGILAAAPQFDLLTERYIRSWVGIRYIIGRIHKVNSRPQDRECLRAGGL